MTRLTACLVLAFLTAGAQAQDPYIDKPGLPDEPQSARIKALVDAFNAGDRAKMIACFQEHLTPELREQLPDEEHADMVLEFHARSGGYDIYGLRHYDPPRPATNRTVIVKNRLLDSWEAFVLEFEPEPPHRITNIGISPARPPSNLPPAPALSINEAMNELKAFIEKLAKADAFSGTTVIAHNGKTIFTHAVGEASKAWHAPVNLDTKFNLGSMNKMFTAVAVAQLVEAGKLSFDDTVDQYLGEDWLPPEVASKITIAQLLSHTSGLGSHFNETYWQASRERFRSVDDFKALVVDQPLRFEPGTDWGYSNAGFLVAGAIIENVTGQSYFDYVQEHIHKPAGMANTACYEMDHDTPNLAIGYSKERGPNGETVWVNNLYKHVIKGGPAGGGFSTSPDLIRFAQALRSDTLISSSMRETLWSPKPNSPQYGYGFGLSGAADQTMGQVVGHGGGFPGISSNLDIFIEAGYDVAVMSNYDTGAVLVSEKARELLRRVKP